jgi:CRP-like cAMP-binding protein
MARSNRNRFDVHAFIAKKNSGIIQKYQSREIVFQQGDPADALFYIISGTVRATIVSEFGKEAVIGLLESDDFFGERCLNENLKRITTITTVSDCEIARFDRAIVIRALTEDRPFASSFMDFILDRNQKLQAALVDRLFNSSEKRLARVLLTLASSGIADKSNVIPTSINQEMLASMVGTTRSRINLFMNKFRKLGYIDYNGRITVNGSLLNLILHEQPHDGDDSYGDAPSAN